MGFDLIGENPKGPEGDYFRINCWWWRILWELCYYVQNRIGKKNRITLKAHESGHYNNGVLITDTQAKELGKVLLQIIEDEEARKEVEKEFKLKKVVINGEEVLVSRDRVLYDYYFSWDNVKEFANFCINSGGFRIY